MYVFLYGWKIRMLIFMYIDWVYYGFYLFDGDFVMNLIFDIM